MIEDIHCESFRSNNRPTTPSDNGFDNILLNIENGTGPVSGTSLWSLYGDPNYGGGAQGNNFYYMPSSTLGSRYG